MRTPYLISFLALTTACGSGPSSDHGHDHGDAHEGHSHGPTSKALDDTTTHSGELVLTAEQFRSLNIRTEEPSYRVMEGSVRLSGKVMSSPLSKAEITAPIAAKVVDVLVDEGAHVKKGQALITLSDVAFFTLQQDYLAARAHRTRSNSELERQRTLVAGDAAARKTLEQARADADEWNATAAALEGTMRLLGIDPAELTADRLHPNFTIRSPIEGRVNGIRVFLGSRVEPSTVLLEVIDLHHFHVHLSAYERDLGLLKEGTVFPFVVMNLPGKNFTGELFSIGRRFDEDGHSIPIHAHVEKGSEDLVEGMSVMAMVPSGGERSLAVPESALARSGDAGFIYVDKGMAPNGEHHYLQVEVVPGLTVDGFTSVAPMIPIDTSTAIVVEGVFYLRNMLTNAGDGH